MSETTGNLEKQKAKAVKTLATMFDYLSLKADLKVTERGPKVAITISSEDAGRIIGRKGQMLESFQTILNRMMYNNDQTFPRVVLDIDGYPRTRVNTPRDGEKSTTPARPSKNSNYERKNQRNSRPAQSSYDRKEERDSSYERSGNRYNNRNSRNDRNDRNDRQERRGGSNEETLTRQALDAAKEVKRWGDPTTLPKMNAHERRLIHVALDGDKEITTTSIGDGNLKNVVISLRK
jgi:spoIIIJ-associated protein